MPQELHVVRCFSCETFQSDIVKKSPKWTCKMCNQKQSLQKVFFNGTGKECRLFAQEVNQRRFEQSQNSQSNIEFEEHKLQTASTSNVNKNKRKPSKWNEFLPATQTQSDENIENNKTSEVTEDKTPMKKPKIESTSFFRTIFEDKNEDISDLLEF